MDYLQKILIAFELHSVEDIRECFENGVNPNDCFRERPLVYQLISEYARGPKFKECVKVFVDYGLNFDDKLLLAVLLDDAITLETLLTEHPETIQNIYTLDCAFTPLLGASLLHICAEYNHLACAEILVKYGADINIEAGVDHYGFGGQTPIFHTVNQASNKCIDVMKFLISQSANLTTTVKGLVWGRGYVWETFIPVVNPISYAMMGLLPQFQRKEKEIYEVVSLLLKAAYNIDYSPLNIPNRYLQKNV